MRVIGAVGGDGCCKKNASTGGSGVTDHFAVERERVRTKRMCRGLVIREEGKCSLGYEEAQCAWGAEETCSAAVRAQMKAPVVLMSRVRFHAAKSI